MNAPIGKVSVVKAVAVECEVEITVADLLKRAGNAELRNECLRRGIPIKEPKSGGPKHKIERDDIEAMQAAFNRRDWVEFLYVLEWALPREFRGLSDFMGAKLK